MIPDKDQTITDLLQSEWELLSSSRHPATVDHQMPIDRNKRKLYL